MHLGVYTTAAEVLRESIAKRQTAETVRMPAQVGRAPKPKPSGIDTAAWVGFLFLTRKP